MKRTLVSSSNVASIGYDPEAKVLEVGYHYGGQVYRYLNVPEHVYRAVVSAESLGSAVLQLVKPNFQAVKVPPVDVS